MDRIIGYPASQNLSLLIKNCGSSLYKIKEKGKKERKKELWQLAKVKVLQHKQRIKIQRAYKINFWSKEN